MLRLNHKTLELDRFKQEMFAVVVHDLKSPMAAVMTSVAHVATELHGASEDVRSSLADIQSACNRIMRLIANLLDLARLEAKQLPLTRKPVNLTSVLFTLAKQRSAQAAAHKAQILTIDLPDLLRVDTDEDLFIRVVENVLDNALRYTPPGGRIEIRAERVERRVQIRIGNTGSAIPVAAQATIFEKFGQASVAGRMNLGLGLYFSRLAMEAHGGRIWVESSPALPTIFALELPL
jgi:signal transduction histidine kinase